ncbi:Sugar transporter STL1-like protein 8 [Zalerion maritima]|uniref:Sugar transporter STL1-like protein 8 n=1 Tax=Zalerion maritima TaxID=339359 RepID=A0AAD5RN21_9PEZI|nr:Sugar transporter STL1-like protein 8 [Zalerion maritima]
MTASRWMPAKGTRRLWYLCWFFALGSFEWGYNIGILSSILIHPGFVSLLSWPHGRSNPSQKGLVTSSYHLGALLSYLFLSQPLSDRLGRRHACLGAVLVSSTGTLLQMCAAGSPRTALLLLVAGRCATGVGSAVMSTTVPTYQAEVAPSGERGRYVVGSHVGFVGGLSLGFWVGFWVAGWEDTKFARTHGWRVGLAVQFVPALVFAAGLPWTPETPRWLVARGRVGKARRNLAWLREGIMEGEEVEGELREIEKGVRALGADINHEAGEGAGRPAAGVVVSFWQSTKELVQLPPLRRRLWRATLLHFMGQMCGATAMKYYLPTLFKSLGFGTRVALMAGGIESLMKIPFTLLDAFLIDRFGRRWTLTVGCAMMAVGMGVNALVPLPGKKGEREGEGNGMGGVGGEGNIDRSAAWIAVGFIFVYAMGYSVGFGPATWVYSSEIFPTHHRSRGLNLSAAGRSIGSLVTSQIWPVGIARTHQNVYFYFTTVNLVCIPIIWLFYPETARVSLENMDILFGSISDAGEPRRSSRNPRAGSGGGSGTYGAEDALLGRNSVESGGDGLGEDGDEGTEEVSDGSDEEADYGWPAYRDEEDGSPKSIRSTGSSGPMRVFTSLTLRSIQT